MNYHLFGLSLSANRPLPGLIESSLAQEPDVKVCLGGLPHGLEDYWRESAQSDYVSPYEDEDGEPVVRTWRLNGGSHIRLRYCDGIEFVVDRSGTRLWARWPDAMSAKDMATYLIGPIMGLMLRLRGFLCLHASAVVVGGRAIAVLGPSGAGKSTTAAAFARLGLPVLTDDIVALDDRSDGFVVQPGDPRLRLWPESVAALYGSSEVLPRLTPTWNKRYLALGRGRYKFEPRARPLAAIYFLAERSDRPAAPVIESVTPRDGFITLATHTYANSLLDRAMRAHEFELLDRLVKNVGLRRVHPHADARKLSELCQAILDDFHAREALLDPKKLRQEADHV